MRVLLTVCLSFVAGSAYLAHWLVVAPRRSPLRQLPGPPSPGFFSTTHLLAILHGETSARTNEELVKRYGRTMRIQGMGGWEDRMLTFDPVAIAHILNRPSEFEKPWQARRLIASLIGCGLLAAEGMQHKLQRRVSNPTFAPNNLRALAPIFFAKAEELRDKWATMLDAGLKEQPAPKIDMVSWFARVTFDIIGLAGFDYKFNAVQDETNKVYRAYRDMFEIAINRGQGLLTVASIYFPVVDILIPSERARVVRNSRRIIQETGTKLISEKKAALESSEKNATSKDLLTLLLKSNMSTEIPADQRISDEDMLNQINTFLFAGSDTTGLAMTWTLYHLARRPDIQTRLQDELQSIMSDAEPTVKLSEIEALPYFDSVVREGLRLVSPVHSTLRVATRDTEVPVSEAVRLQDGRLVWSVKIARGQMVHVPMEGCNLDREAWGDDAWEFNPDRWNALPETVLAQPGLYAHTMTFSAGPRACIGQRFSIMEIKVLLFVLLSAFDFSEPENLFKANVVLTRPFVRCKGHEPSQSPLRVTRREVER